MSGIPVSLSFQELRIVRQKRLCCFIRRNTRNRFIDLQSILHLSKTFYCRMLPSTYLWEVSMEKVEDRLWMKNNYHPMKVLRKLRYGRVTVDYNRCSIMKQCHVGGYILLLHIHDQHLFVGSFSWLLILKRRLIIRFIPIQKK